MDELHSANENVQCQSEAPRPYFCPIINQPVVIQPDVDLGPPKTPVETSLYLTDHSLERLLTGHEKLTLQSSEKIGFYSTCKITYIRSNPNLTESLMTIKETIHSERDESHILSPIIVRSALTAWDSAGKVLLTCKGAGPDFTVKIDEIVLGYLSTNGYPCCLNFHSALGNNHEVLFETVKHGSEFIFTSHGITIASAGKDGDTFAVRFSASVDLCTRAMIVVQSYYIFTWYFVETKCKYVTGTVGLSKIFFYAMLIFAICTILTIVLCIIFGSDITFVRNGTAVIATAKKGIINGDDFGVVFSPNLDAATKAMITAASYFLDKVSSMGITEYIENFPQHDRPLDPSVFTVSSTSNLIPVRNDSTTVDVDPATPDNLLKEILQNHEMLKFHSIENFGMTGCIEGKSVKISGVNGEAIMSASLIPLTLEPSEEKTLRVNSGFPDKEINQLQKFRKYHQNQQSMMNEEYNNNSEDDEDIDVEKRAQDEADHASSSHTLRFKDNQDTSMISCFCHDTFHNYSVHAGDRLIGYFNGIKDSFLWWPKLYTWSSTAEKMYDVKREGSKFTFISNELVLAEGKRDTSEKHTFQLKFQPLLDVDTKAMLIVTSWWIYVFYCARTRWCFSGIVKISNCFLITLMTTFLTVCITLAVLGILKNVYTFFMEKSDLNEFTPTEPPPSYFDSTTPNTHGISIAPIGASTSPAYTGVNVFPSESLETILGHHGLLTFRAMDKIWCNSGALIVQIRDSQDQILMSSMLTTTVVGNENTQSEKLVTFTDINGKFLLSCKESAPTVVVNGERLYGVINRIGRFFPTGLRAQNTVGEEVFRTHRDTDGCFRFLNNGTVIATASNTETSYGNAFSLEFSPSLGFNTKALLIAASYYLNILFFAETGCGCRGALKMYKFSCLIPFILVLLIFAALIIFSEIYYYY
ncbi:unnamed protein product [Allacma fusca]|uniref:Uncharacterized protein n=1 Tax=Allacma fusca TaxID=39272 RepID=A0A8J2K6Q9_9HEXA|nr:unnamed protein product [Allacma fusca]